MNLDNAPGQPTAGTTARQTARLSRQSLLMLIAGRIFDDPTAIPEPGWLEIDRGRIVDRGSGMPGRSPDLGSEQTIITPAFVDAHLHLPQFTAIGCSGLDLLQWLEQVIFPAELAWDDPAIAEQQIRGALRRLVRAGTFSFAGYLTSHRHGLSALSRALQDIPLRCRAGVTLMDENGPAGLIEQPLPDRDDFEQVESDRLSISVNPRFAVSCSDELLARAAPLAGGDRWIQTHLAETHDEVELVRRRFPDAKHYAAVYDKHGLIGPRTLLAHCLHLSREEWQMIAAHEAIAVHCPTANTFLRSGSFDLAAAREHNVRVALGSDVAGGPDISMPRVARAMIEVATFRRLHVDPKAPIPTPAEVWSLITRGNAAALGWDDVGSLAVGSAADLLLLEVPFEPDAFFCSRLLYTWDQCHIRQWIIHGSVFEVQ